MAAKAPIPQNDNVAHALAGAGGGILSMVLTCVGPPAPANRLTLLRRRRH